MMLNPYCLGIIYTYIIKKNTVTAKQKDNHDLFAILMVCLGYFSYSVMDALSKYIVGELPIPQITMTINAISAVMIFGVVLKKHGISGVKSTHYHLHAIRVLFFIAVPYFILKALGILTLTQFYSVIFTAPIIIMLLSILWLNEKLEIEKIIMAVIGLLGVFITIQAEIISRLDGLVYCLIGMILIVGNTITLRKIRHISHPLLFALYPSVALTIVYTPFAITSYIPPTGSQWIILIVSGIAVFGGQIGCVTGFTKASSTSTVAPYHYTQIIWGALFGYFIFENVPSVSSSIGIVLIIYSGLYIALLQRKQKRQRRI